MTHYQSRAARSILNWSIGYLSVQSKVSITSISNFERGITGLTFHNSEALKRTFENSGIELIEGGVRISKGAGDV